MKFCALFLALAVGSLAAEPLILKDGRTYQDWSVIAQADQTVTIKYPKGISKIQKTLLPPELLAKYPITFSAAPVPVPAEPATERAPAAKSKTSAEVAIDERVRAAFATARKNQAGNEAREAAQEKAREDLAESYRGLILRGVVSSFGEIDILLENVTGGTVTFDWTQLRLKDRNSEEEHPFGGVNFRGAREDYTIPAGRQQIFSLKQTAPMEVQSIWWVGGSKRYPVKVLYRRLNSWHMDDQYTRESNEQNKSVKRGEPPAEDELMSIMKGYSAQRN